ncbi:N-acetylglucosamine kinase [Risungbinella massiliensis]|uniref:N-acetylglucosamine kinase n=1 Tax=Risungbinella massiliensis TaxID=1329796 RepID=UPI00069AC966|nr:BadF/BadG/BcrA/BcrD ATPase family protein [Risungbinella massiliensis]
MYLIGVDGGGTKTEAVAYDLEGNMLSSATSGFGNILIDYEKASRHIIEVIQQTQQLLPEAHCVAIYLGLAGIEGSDQKKALEALLVKTFSCTIQIVNDAVIAHAALLQGKDGILTIAGTGSVSLGKRGNTYTMAGGWGHLIGDEGSGYWIAMEAIRQMVQHEDIGTPASKLSLAILDQLQLTKVQEIKQFVYAATKDEIASLVPIVVKMARVGEPTSQGILEIASRHLAETTWYLAQKLSWNGHLTVAIKGSVLEKIPEVRQAFQTHLHRHHSQLSLLSIPVSSTKGALYLYQNTHPKDDSI